MSISRRQYLIIVCTIISVQAWGQVANSPFSKFGLGENYSNALANTQGMAGVGVSQPQYWFVNNQNPALLVYNSFATFQVGVLGESRTIKGNAGSEKFRGGNMNYLLTSFALKPGKWVTSLGLMPYSSVNYSIRSIIPVEGKENENQIITEEGSGGFTQLYWSNGVRINQNFSIGLKTSYLFGAIDKIYKLQKEVNDGSFDRVSAPQSKTVAKDFNFSLGGSYIKDSLWNKDYRVSIGAVYEFATDINANLINKVSDLSLAGDTITSTETKTSGSLNLPSSITAGVSFSKGVKWSVGTQFTYQDWSSFSNLKSPDYPVTDEELSKLWRVAIGGEYTPDPSAIEGFLKRITYRIGVSTERCPYLVNDNPVKDTGINFGFSFPSGRSSIDLGFKFGTRGDVNDNILEERYFKVFFGITFNDQWFIRRRFD
jgi:hypothetical protein